MSGTRLLRPIMLALLAVSSLAPFALLAAASVGRDWFWPALLPPRLSADAWRALLGGGARFAAAAATSAALALGTGVLAVVAGFPAARALARLHRRLRHLAAAALFLPVAAPPIALGVGLQVSFLTLGLGGTLAGVLLAHAVPAVAYAALYLLGVVAQLDPRLEDEARALGATPRQTLVRVVLPALRRPLAEAFVLGALVSWAQVPLTLLVGGGAVSTLPLEVLAYARAGQDRWAAAGALALVIPALAALAAVALGVRRTEAVAL